MSDENVKNILNLVPDLNKTLVSYFEKAGIKLLNRADVEEIEKLDYILIFSQEEVLSTCKEYNTLKNEIKIICCDNVHEVKNFLASNGRLVLNDNLKNDLLGNYILEKFFTESFNIHLDESFQQSLPNVQSFKVTNHLVTGDAIDELSVYAFEAGFNLVPLRSFVDHSIYYFTYLKQAGLAGIPFEFEYGNNEDYFVVNVHANVKNFVAEYMIDCFGKVNSSEPLSYLLNIVGLSCDFLDLTYIEVPGKVVLTAFFAKSSENKVKGMAFNNILTTAQVSSKVNKQIANFVPQAQKTVEIGKKQDGLKSKGLPGGILDMVAPVAESSILNKFPDKTEELIGFMVEHFEGAFPDRDIKEFMEEHFKNFSGDFSDIEFLGKLTDEDVDYLVERIQKNQLAKAYSEEVRVAREELKEDDIFIKSIQDTMSDRLAESVAGQIGADVLNQILATPDFPEATTVVTSSVFGEFVPSIPIFDMGDAFEDIETDFGDIEEFDVTSVFYSLVEEIEIALVSGDEDPEEEMNNILGSLPEEEETNNISGGGPEDEGVNNIPGGPSDEDEEVINISGSGPEEEDVNNVFGSLPEEEDTINISGFDEDEDAFSNILGLPEEPEWSTRISGGEEEEDGSTRVSGSSEDEDDFSQIISGISDDDNGNFMSSISNGFEDNKGEFNFKSTGQMEEEMINFVSRSMNTPDMKDMNASVKGFVTKEAPALLSRGLESFASGLGIPVADLNVDQLSKFKQNHIPEIMSYLMVDENKIKDFNNSSFDEDPSFEQKLRRKLETKLSSFEDLDREDDVYVLNNENLPPEQMQELVKGTMKEMFDEEFSFATASPEEITAKENQLVDEFTETFKMSTEEASSIVREASDLAREKEKEVVANKLFSGESVFDEDVSFDPQADLDSGGEYVQQTNSKVESELISKLKNSDSENSSLRMKITSMELQLSASQSAKEGFDDIIKDVDVSKEEIAQKMTTVEEKITEVEKVQILADLADGKPLSPEDAGKIKDSLDRTTELLAQAKVTEGELRKKQIESEKKDGAFKSALEKASQSVKARTLILDKAKESMKNIVVKKEGEVMEFKQQVVELNKKLASDQSVQLKSHIKSLEREKEAISKTMDVFKTKLETATQNANSRQSDNKDNNTEMIAENRKLKNQQAQLEARVKSEERAKRTAEDQFQRSKQGEIRAKGEVKLAEMKGTANLKKATDQLLKMAALNKDMQQKVDNAVKGGSGASVSGGDGGAAQASKDAAALKQAGNEAQNLKSQNDQLQSKLTESMAKLKNAERSAAAASSTGKGDADKRKLATMNAEMSKGKAEVSAQKKETMKAKAEVNGLKNKLKALERDLARAKASGGGKKKAA